jgi:acetylornithine/succinyldiaminopimelate/putrescine aminotransferase
MEKKQKTYLDVLQESMQPMKDMQSYYEKRIKLIDQALADTSRTLWEQNEDRILRIKTLQEIDVLKKILHQKNEYFKNYAAQFEQDLKEAKKNFKETVKKCWVVAEKNDALMKLMNAANFKEAERNDEVLVIMYNKFKQFV